MIISSHMNIHKKIKYLSLISVEKKTMYYRVIASYRPTHKVYYDVDAHKQKNLYHTLNYRVASSLKASKY